MSYILFFISFAFYLFCLAPTVTAGDSGNLVAAASVLGVAHPPGYPLYCLLGKIFTLIIPWGNIAYRTNLMSAFFASATLGLMVKIVSPVLGSRSVRLRRIGFGENREPNTENRFRIRIQQSIIASLVILSFAFSPSLGKTAVTTEVFALNTFWATLIILAVIRKKNVALLSFLFGLGLGNQHTLILLLPGIILAVIFALSPLPPKASLALKGGWERSDDSEEDDTKHRTLSEGRVRGIRLIFIGLFFFCLGFSVYFYMPIRSRINPPIDWENPETISSFGKAFTRARYGSFQIAQGEKTPFNFQSLWSQTVFSKNLLDSQIGKAGLILGLFGIFYLKEWILLLFFLISGPAFVYLTNLSPGEAATAVLERFQILPALVLIIGTAIFLIRIRQKFKYIVILLPFLFWRAGFSDIFQRDNFLVYDYCQDIFRSLPQGAQLFSDRADEVEFSLGYLQLAEKKRTDLTIVDCNAGVFYNIYGNDYYQIWGKPRLLRREQIEKQIIASSVRPVYYASLDLKQIPDLYRIQQGLVYLAPKNSKGETPPFLDYSQIYVLRLNKRLDNRSGHLAATYPYLLGQYFLAHNKKENAQREFARLKMLEKNFLPTIAFWYYHQGWYKEAIEEYKRAIELQPKQAELYNNLGATYEALKDDKNAEANYLKAIEIDPNYAETHYNLAVIYWGRGEWTKVVQELELTLKLDPNHQRALQYLPLARKKL